MNSKPVPIDLVPYAHLIEGSREFLRTWADPEGRIACFINPVPLGPDPALFGVALVEAARNAARTYAQAVNISEAEAQARIWHGLDTEREDPIEKIAIPIAPNQELN